MNEESPNMFIKKMSEMNDMNAPTTKRMHSIDDIISVTTLWHWI